MSFVESTSTGSTTFKSITDGWVYRLKTFSAVVKHGLKHGRHGRQQWCNLDFLFGYRKCPKIKRLYAKTAKEMNNRLRLVKQEKHVRASIKIYAQYKNTWHKIYFSKFAP
jgi:hypothetical protein